MQRNIVCLKWGEKYSPHYVNVLYSMCKRNSTIPFKFICMTDNDKGLDPNILTKPLPNLKLYGWWLKPYVFCKDNNFESEVLFLDLDLVIHNNFDKLWEYSPGSFCIIRDFTRKINPKWQKYNSSVFRFRPKDYYWIWEDFFTSNKKIVSKHHGDQDYLYSLLQSRVSLWPDEWIQSYKWEMRDRNDVKLINGRRNFVNIKDPTLIHDNCIAVFHGEPNPHDVKDPWVIENWK